MSLLPGVVGVFFPANNILPSKQFARLAGPLRKKRFGGFAGWEALFTL